MIALYRVEVKNSARMSWRTAGTQFDCPTEANEYATWLCHFADDPLFAAKIVHNPTGRVLQTLECGKWSTSVIPSKFVLRAIA